MIRALLTVAVLLSVGHHSDQKPVSALPQPVELPPLVDTVAVATAPAQRLDPPSPVPDPVPTGLNGLPFAPDSLSGCAEMSWYRQQAGLPARFDALGWRESNCRNEDRVRTGCCHGWWQLSVSLHLRDPRLAWRYHDCGVYSYADVNSDNPYDKQRQACAARAVYDVVGFSAWRTR